ncbi:hypothetical protein AB0C65_06535 [Nocardia sp. NPDC048505]|uniref:hypothetical protein n=1 Tax=Nocardia sp. NPDC048505 TaxID=3155756 RepID=UPI0033D2110E
MKSTNTLMYWNGTSFESFADAFGAAGPDGRSSTISIGTVTTGTVDSDLEVTVTGTPPELTLHLKVPRGIPGQKGPSGGPGPLREAPDYTNGVHADRAVPVWNASTGKWTPRPHPGLRGPWSIVEASAWDGGPGFAATQINVATSPNTVAMLNIPAQNTAWRPVIAGGVVVRSYGENFAYRIDAEVRIGSISGQIIALGAGLPFATDSYARFQPYFGVNAMTPDSAAGVIPANTAVTLYVVLRRVAEGSGNYNYNMPGAHITCWAKPVGI